MPDNPRLTHEASSLPPIAKLYSPAKTLLLDMEQLVIQAILLH